MPNVVAIGQIVAEIWRFFDFCKTAAAAIFDCFKFRNFSCHNGQDSETASPCQISLRLVKLLRIYGDLSIFPRWRPSAILGFQNLTFLQSIASRGSNCVITPNFWRSVNSNRCRDMANFTAVACRISSRLK